MKQPPVLIKKIYQKNNNAFVIEWSDGKTVEYVLNDLQKKCPCAQCYDPAMGKQICNENQLDPNVKAVRLVNVGRYAMRIQFSSGCSKGIYSFALLRQLVTVVKESK